MTRDNNDNKLEAALSANNRIALIVGAAVLAVVIGAVGVALYFTSSPSFFARYSSLSRRYDTLSTSSHKDLACSDCHSDARGPVVYRLALVADFYAGLLGKQSDPLFTKLAPPTRDACIRCHANDWSDDSARTAKVPHPAHLKVANETRDCVGCHRWTAHEETYMANHKKMPFSGVCATYGCHVGFKPAAACPTCHHSLQNSDEQWKQVHPQVVQVIGANACLETCHNANQCRQCHTTGVTPVFNGLATQQGLQEIEANHVKADWVQQHGRFALQDKSKCLTCHVSEGECQDCHSQRPAFHGSKATWLGQHQPQAKADRQRCLTCHKESFCEACHNQFKAMR